MSEYQPLVSVIMPCLNGARFIRKAIESVQTQTLEDWQLLVIDNGSTDGSVKVVQEFERTDARIVLLSDRRGGAAAARNQGIDAARGRYIAFLDCDDMWLPTKLMDQVGTMGRDRLRFCWTSYEVVNEEGTFVRNQNCAVRATYEDVLHKRTTIGCLTAIYDTEAFGKQFMPDIRMRQDFALWLRLLRTAATDGHVCRGIDKTLARYRVHKGGMTYNKARAAYYQWRVYRDIERLPLPKRLACMRDYIVGAMSDRAR